MSTTGDHGNGASGRKVRQVLGLWRTVLQQHDLSPGREVVQDRVEISAEATPARHIHPGEEIIGILEEPLECQAEGQPARTCNTGDALTVAAGVVHVVRSVGSSNAAEVVTYVVEKRKPVITLAE